MKCPSHLHSVPTIKTNTQTTKQRPKNSFGYSAPRNYRSLSAKRKTPKGAPWITISGVHLPPNPNQPYLLPVILAASNISQSESCVSSTMAATACAKSLLSSSTSLTSHRPTSNNALLPSRISFPNCSRSHLVNTQLKNKKKNSSSFTTYCSLDAAKDPKEEETPIELSMQFGIYFMTICIQFCYSYFIFWWVCFCRIRSLSYCDGHQPDSWDFTPPVCQIIFQTMWEKIENFSRFKIGYDVIFLLNV